MEERHELGRRKPRGLSTGGLRTLALGLLLLGVFGASVLQRGILKLDGLNSHQLLEKLNHSEAMGTATAVLLLRVCTCCAVPLFAFLTLEGFLHTSRFSRYLLRVAVVAAISEVPFHFAMAGTWFRWEAHNPVLGVVIALIMLYLFQYFQGQTLQRRLLRGAICLAAVLWAGMLRVEEGVPFVLLTAVFWALRNRPGFRTMGGCMATLLCCLFSPYYLGAPLTLMAVHAYNGEEGTVGMQRYALYPAALVLAGLAVQYM